MTRCVVYVAVSAVLLMAGGVSAEQVDDLSFDAVTASALLSQMAITEGVNGAAGKPDPAQAALLAAGTLSADALVDRAGGDGLSSSQRAVLDAIQTPEQVLDQIDLSLTNPIHALDLQRPVADPQGPMARSSSASLMLAQVTR